MNLSIVVAVSDNNVIGKNNQLLWRLPNDMKFFKNTTWGMPVIMGRKTFESLGQALKGRTNIVVSRQPNYKAENATVVETLEAAMEVAAATDAREAFVIGGGEIYRQSLPLVHRLYLTRVQVNLDGDAFFPEFEETNWELLSQIAFEADEQHAYPYRFEVWQRRTAEPNR